MVDSDRFIRLHSQLEVSQILRQDLSHTSPSY